MKILYLITGILLAIWMAAVWVTSLLLRLHSLDSWVFRIGLIVIGAGAAAAFLWWHRMRTEAPAGGAELMAELDLFTRTAERELKSRKKTRFGDVPLFFLLGDTGAAKTSTFESSGLNPDLLAGHIYKDGKIVATRSANFWFARNTVFAEAAGALLRDSASWLRFVHKLRRRSASRGVVLCVDVEGLVNGGEARTATLARDLRIRMSEISSSYGIRFPVYVLFTRADRLLYFHSFVRNLSNDEATQPVGVTLPLTLGEDPATYQDRQTTRIAQSFDRLFRTFADSRGELLTRENDSAIRPDVYEFPREFQKLRSILVPFLLDVCRPGHLNATPFLRGYYFCGIRRASVEKAEQPPTRPKPAGPAVALTGATSIFQPGQLVAQPEAEDVGTRRVDQWVFLRRLFEEVLLKDSAALSVSVPSTKTVSRKAWLWAGASAVSLAAAVAFAVSWIGNRELERRTIDAARAIADSEATGMDLPSVDALARLDSLRSTLELISFPNGGAPWRLRWGLYSGAELYPTARRIYFDRFRQLLFSQTETSLIAFLRRLSPAPAPGDEYGPPYDALKAYLLTTSDHERSTPQVLTPVLIRYWSSGRTIDAARVRLARAQFDFYADELRRQNPYSAENDDTLIERSRRYLAQFEAFDRIYGNMVDDVAHTTSSIQFNRRFPQSAESVIDTREVSGTFSKAGWELMGEAMRHPERYAGGEVWVLGKQTASNHPDPLKLEQDLRFRYTSEFIAHWRDFLKSAAVVRYSGLADAATKLKQLSGNQSPLLALFWLVSQNTAVGEPKLTEAFQPAQSVVPPGPGDRYILPPNQQYMSKLAELAIAVEQLAAGIPGGPTSDAAAATALNAAITAKSAAVQMAQTFRPDPDGKVDAITAKLLQDPINYVEQALHSVAPADANAKGKGFCAQFAPVLAKYPFNPSSLAEATFPEVNSILKRPDGALWTFYETTLQKLVVRQGSTYVPLPGAAISVTQPFLTFFNQSAALSDALYLGGSQEPRLNFALKALPSPGIDRFTLRLDGQTMEGSPSAGPAKQFVWPGQPREASISVESTQGNLAPLPVQGNWAVFQLFDAAQDWRLGPSGTWQFSWMPSVSLAGRRAGTGSPKIYFEINMGGAAPILRRGSLPSQCVSTVAR